MDLSQATTTLAQLTPRQRRALEWLLRERGVSPDALPIGRAETATGPLPLSFAQQRIWFTCELAGDSAVYNVPWPMRIRGPLDAAALERSLNAIVRRHAALR